MRNPLHALLILFFLSLTLGGQDVRGPLNEHLPSWITLGAQVRYRAEGLHDQNYLLERYRFDVGIQPLPWMAFFSEFQDARAAHMPIQDASVKDRVDLRQAYVRIGKEDGWWDVKAGRQRLVFGSERVIGASEWGNTARVFDAIKLAFHHKNDRFDVFSSSVVMNNPTAWDHHLDGNNLHGVYGSFGSWIKDSKVEPYVLLRTGLRKGWTYGLRSAGRIGPKWTYETEALGQHSDQWAGLLQIQRHFRDFRWAPALVGETNYASGGLDQLYPTNHSIYGIADQIGRRNTKNVRGGIWLHPEKWLTLKGEGHFFWLADSHEGLYAASGAQTVAPVIGGAKYTDVGPELDLLADVKLSRFYDIGAQYGHLFPGKFLETYSNGAGRSFYAVFLDFHL
ncbi:MAG: alginate export family protein [Acidobacteria bacterium]|nr:alginate export family protein [Acidobacteriota bacterium]